MTSPEVPVARLGTDLKLPDSVIPTSIARVADIAGLAGSVNQTQLDAAIPKKLYSEHECPNGIAIPRPTVPAGTRVIWCMSVLPPQGGAYMQTYDKWRPTDI